mmetsp:Transcript_23947/g.83118  ORF Transcript_23947/g.83118 Transcript_23947/m.83118 type:complete len:303 (-) Transcript_23947:59-967(-)
MTSCTRRRASTRWRRRYTSESSRSGSSGGGLEASATSGARQRTVVTPREGLCRVDAAAPRLLAHPPTMRPSLRSALVAAPRRGATRRGRRQLRPLARPALPCGGRSRRRSVAGSCRRRPSRPGAAAVRLCGRTTRIQTLTTRSRRSWRTTRHPTAMKAMAMAAVLVPAPAPSLGRALCPQWRTSQRSVWLVGLEAASRRGQSCPSGWSTTMLTRTAARKATAPARWSRGQPSRSRRMPCRIGRLVQAPERTPGMPAWRCRATVPSLVLAARPWPGLVLERVGATAPRERHICRRARAAAVCH